MTTVVTVNGDVVAFDSGATLGDVVLRTMTKPDGTYSDSGIAVAVNQIVVPRSDWAATPLRADDKIEIITAVQGG
ncbi:sulfur carrier protein ThiS [Jiangella rhizosphaerae]|uniref:Sulfur carrier protein ThiS n=1 Tax=Jiangella rhizosphaerae TaxID=2293569 RepID=A0A418KV39_9ACTN|nr:sulfur carrier protein ThiS [Jiangella rhizosphaerae]RIQ31181.1 sulfur carrier protein ThiS [Jiangella rhizosphaerae]